MTEVLVINESGSNDLLFKSVDKFLYDRDLHRERVKWTRLRVGSSADKIEACCIVLKSFLVVF